MFGGLGRSIWGYVLLEVLGFWVGFRGSAFSIEFGVFGSSCGSFRVWG